MTRMVCAISLVHLKMPSDEIEHVFGSTFGNDPASPLWDDGVPDAVAHRSTIPIDFV